MRFSLKGKASSPIKKYEKLFSLPFRGTAEEDIKFLFLVFFIELSVRKNTDIRNSSLTSLVDKHEVVISIY